MEGTWGAQIVDELQPQESEHLIAKKGFGGFSNTPLDTVLRNNTLCDPGYAYPALAEDGINQEAADEAHADEEDEDEEPKAPSTMKRQTLKPAARASSRR